jgi:hypothetical protein
MSASDATVKIGGLSWSGAGRSVMNWWFKPVPLARAAVFRLFVYGFIPLDVVVFRPWGAAHGSVDPALYAPLQIGRLLPLPTPTSTLVVVIRSAVVVAAIVLFLLVLTNRMPKLQTILGWVAAFGYLEWMVISFSYGKVDHDRFAFLVALFVLPTIGRAALRDQTPSQSAGWALRNVQIAVVATYFLAACAKVRFGGWGWVNSATILRAVVRRGTFLADPLMDHPWTLQATQWFIVIIEFTSPILLFVRERWQYAIVAFLVIFHIMTFAMITIIFLPHVLCMLSFLPLERLVPRWRSAQTPSVDPQPQPSV